VVEQDKSDGGHPGAVLRKLRHTAGRRISQHALATLLGTSRAHVARLELQGFPPLTDEQLDRLEKAGDAVRPPFSPAEISELRKAMRSVGPDAIKQADKAVRDIAAGAAQIFPPRSAGTNGGDSDISKQRHGAAAPAAPEPFASSSRPKFLAGISSVVDAAEEDIKHLTRQYEAGQAIRSAAEPDLIMTHFGPRSLVEEAQQPESFRDAVRAALRAGATVEHLIAPAAEADSHDLVALVPHIISYLAQVDDSRHYRVHVIPESKHPLAYGICIAGDRGMLIAPGDNGRAIAVRTNDCHDVTALRDLLRPYWEGQKTIVEQLGRRTPESLTGCSTAGPSVGLRFERVLTSVEVQEEPRRLVKEGLSIINIPVAIHAWKWRAAELCAAGWIPEDLLKTLHAHAWELAAHGLGQLPRDELAKYPPGSQVRDTLTALETYAQGLQVRRAAWGDQLSRHDFWDASPKSALIRFMSTGELPRDEIPSACEYVAERDDIELIIRRLITRLRSTPNYHLALIDEAPVPEWFYFGVKGAHVLAQVFDSAGMEGSARHPDENMLSIHIDYAPIAEAFAGWFDEHVLKAAVDPPWQDNRSVASWLEATLEASGRPR
jgi:hypothetical protein